MTTFRNPCNCGGYAHTLNGRPAAQPHMTWCPQYAEYAAWFKATQGEKK